MYGTLLFLFLSHLLYGMCVKRAAQRPRRLLTDNIQSGGSSILGDSGAVSRVGRKGATKVFKYGRKIPWVPTLTELFPKIQADAGSWLGTKDALYYCAQSANSFSWVLFVSLYTTAIVSITACLAHAPKLCTQSGNFQFDINPHLISKYCLPEN